MFPSSSPNSKSLWYGKFLVVLAILVIAIAVWVFVTGSRSVQKNLSSTFNVDPNAYYAVFLSNEQVNFGKIRTTTHSFLRLEDIYYLQLTQTLQQGDTPNDGASKRSEFTLIKLGKEVHGPKDWMNINMQQILFIEELKNDSQIVKNILREKTLEKTPKSNDTPPEDSKENKNSE